MRGRRASTEVRGQRSEVKRQRKGGVDLRGEERTGKE